MSQIFEEFQLKFANIESKIELKQNSVNDLFQREKEALNGNWNQKILEENYSKELNLCRDGLLKQISTNLRLEIDKVNLETKQIKNLKFKRGVVKSEKLCLKRVIKKEFKFKREFAPSKLVKYKKFLGLEEVIQTGDESTDEKILLKAMLLASRNGQLEIVKYLVEHGADLNAKDEDNETAFILASKCGHLGIAKFLVETGADVNAEGKFGWTALIYASRRGNLEMVKYLVENVANVNSKYDKGWTALMFASENGNLEIVKYLLQNGSDVNAKYENRWTALMYASRRGHLEIVKYLVEYGADVNSKYDNDSMTVLMLASENGHIQVVKYFVVEHGSDFNSQDKNKALMSASENGYFEIVKYLAESGADLNPNDYLNDTALAISFEQGHSKKLMLKQSAVNSNDKNSEVSSILPSNKPQKKRKMN